VNLDEALDVLISIHTRDDPKTGFIVELEIPFKFNSKYVEAWKIVRQHSHFRTEPGHYPKEGT